MLLAAALSGCSGAAPTPPPLGEPHLACPPGAALDIPTGFELVPAGTVAFGWAVEHNAGGSSATCGAVAVEGARTTIPSSILDGEDRISWTAVLDWPGRPASLPPIPTWHFVRLDPGGPVSLAMSSCDPHDRYRCEGAVGHGLGPGTYQLRVLSTTGDVLAQGQFTIS